ncbi:MAG: TetR/AcrR family transcriptional regulator [Tissierellia bacterium]|nr:TetR/AcrR family transcriptional regulator [Tissierellia bacterium]
MTYRQRMAKKTRDKILGTAIDLFKKKGYANVSIAEIVNTAGVSRGSFYAHYKNKDDLLDGAGIIKENDYSIFYEALRNAPCFADIDPLQKLKSFLYQTNSIIVSDSTADMIRHYYSYMIQSSKNLLRSDRTYNRIIMELLGDCRQHHLLNNIYTDEQILEMCTLLNRGICIDWAMNDGSFPIESKNYLIDNFISTISV